MTDPTTAYVKDLAVRLDVVLVKLGECFNSTVIYMINKTRLPVKEIVISGILSTKVLRSEWPLLRPLG